MAKKKDFDFGAFIDHDALDALMESKSSISPTVKEVEIVEKVEGDIKNIQVENLIAYHKHTYKVLDNDDMKMLIKSIKEIGIILPLLVRRQNDGLYEVVSGHRRLFAAKALEMESVPCKILDVDNATADIMMVDTNLSREEILPSEQAKSYEVRIEAMKELGLIDGLEGEHNYEEQLAKEINSSRSKIYRYRKLLSLVPELLDLVDIKKLPVAAATKLADLNEKNQNIVLESLNDAKGKVSAGIAEKICLAANSGLTKEKVDMILAGSFSPRNTNAEPKTDNKFSYKITWPKAITKLSDKKKEEFIKDCIKAFVQENEEWNGIQLK